MEYTGFLAIIKPEEFYEKYVDAFATAYKEGKLTEMPVIQVHMAKKKLLFWIMNAEKSLENMDFIWICQTEVPYYFSVRRA